MRVYDGAGNPVKGNRDIPMPERVQRVVQNGDQCPSCGTDHLNWYTAKYTGGDRCICTNCGYDLTVSEDLKRGEVIVK